ncbi:hypothetical protein C8J56DRAFT_427299 [Mycena floridula]|nr:hypothetical protein C8J56DRAFT_427299 [Mycena floridula]
MARRLDLHASALSDSEYSLYTSILSDITLSNDPDIPHDDAYYNQQTVGVREARAWLRGRYSHVPASNIDSILKFFSPTLAQTDYLSGGQFFAALRLVVHAESGKNVDRALAFVQAHPPLNRSGSPSKAPETISTVPSSNVDSEFTRSTTSSNNPFVLSRSKSMTSSRSLDGSVRIPPLPPRKPPPIPSLPPPRHSSVVSSAAPPKPATAPPVLPRTASHVTSTLMKQSLQASKAAQVMKNAEVMLEKERIMQVLKSSSSTGPSRNRSTSPNKMVKSSSSSYTSGSDEAPPLPRRRPKESPPMSVTSLERVALASTSSPFRARVESNSASDLSPQSSPSRTNVELPVGPPPTHPDRKPPFSPNPKHTRTPSFSVRSSEPEPFEMVYGPSSPTSPTSRIFRSKSMHHPSSPIAPAPPPPRRKRPESYQFQSSANSVFSDDNEIAPPVRRPQHNRETSSSFDTLSNLQRTLSQLQPKLDKARYKAEAGISRRGFVRDGVAKNGLEGEEEAGLMSEPLDENEASVFDDAYAVSDSDPSSPAPKPSKDDGWDGDKEWVGVEKDHDKWPLGGWKPL